MEKQVARWSYILGVVCAVVAAVWRLAAAVGMPRQLNMGGGFIGYWSFFSAASLLLLVSIATYCYLQVRKD